MKRKSIVALLCCAVMLTSLVGCGSSSNSSSETDAMTGKSDSEATVDDTAASMEEDRPVVSFVFTKGGFESVPENAVSYTHLDVYKRQELPLRRKHSFLYP